MISLGYWKFFTLSGLSGGEKIQSIHSPDKTYTLHIYRHNGGATTSFAIRGELVTNTKKFMNMKNIYWNYREEDATVQWLDNHTVMINKHKLHVETDTYDFRKNKEKRTDFYQSALFSLSHYSNVTSTCTISDLLPSLSGGPQNPKPEETIAWNAPFCAYPQSSSYILLVTI